MGGTHGHPASFARVAVGEGSNGFALPAALLMVMLIAALIAGAFGAVTEETRMGAAAAERQHALLSAESALDIVISEQTASSLGSVGPGGTQSRRIGGLEVPVVVFTTRLDSSRYWLVADAGDTSSRSGIARRIGVLVRVRNGASGSISIDRIHERWWSELF